MMQEIMVRLEGVAPLIMHNIQLADPRNEYARKIKDLAGKRNKTDADLLELCHLEWIGGLYVNGDGRIIVPGEVIESTLAVAAGMIIKGGKKLFRSGVFVFDPSILEYDGPKDPEMLYEKNQFVYTTWVRVQNSRIIRTRPIFPSWAIETIISYHPEIVNEKQVISALEYAGRIVGFCDYRPRYGRF